MITLYGIPNCDSIKKARKWLTDQEIEYQFHDYRKDGISNELIQEFIHTFGWQQVVNKRGTTYRQLSAEVKDKLDETMALNLLLEQPAMIKRPILRLDNSLHLGFNADDYTTLLSSSQGQ